VGDYNLLLIDRYVLFPQHYPVDDPVLTEIATTANFVKALLWPNRPRRVNETCTNGQWRAWGKYLPDALLQVLHNRPMAQPGRSMTPELLSNQLLGRVGLEVDFPSLRWRGSCRSAPGPR